MFRGFKILGLSGIRYGGGVATRNSRQFGSTSTRIPFCALAPLDDKRRQHYGHCNRNKQNHQLRSLATSAQKRAREQQKRVDGGKDIPADNVSAPLKNATQPTNRPPSSSNSTSSQPGSLIRTDFALNTTNDNNGSAQQLTMPSGYEIPMTNTDNDDAQSSLSPPSTRKLLDDAQTFSYVDYKGIYDPQIHLPSAPQDWDGYEAATPLWEELAAQIGVLGRPMTVAEFMQYALLHPKYGYYSQPMRDRAENSNDSDDDMFSDSDDDDDDGNSQDNPIFGPRGDFVTAPEICQVFGESIQVWMVTQWEAMGKPKAIQWVEFGPGRGTLMADMVRCALSSRQQQAKGNDSDKLAEYSNALQMIHLIEPSQPLRQKQQESLQEQLGDIVNWEFYNPIAEDVGRNETKASKDDNAVKSSSKHTIQVHWHNSFAALTAMIMRRKQRKMGHETGANNKVEDETADVSNMPLFVICQEFFDALPVHAFEMSDTGVWRERLVDVAISDEMLEQNDDGEIGSSDTVDKKLSSASSVSSINDIEGVKRPRLRIVLAPEATPALKTLMRVDADGKALGEQNSTPKAKVGQVVEVCPEGILVVQDIASLLEQQGGAAIIVDYGEEGSTDSLRGFLRHKQTHFLSLPGQTDVTADVDFAALKHAVNYPRSNQMQQPPAGKGDNKGKDKATSDGKSKHMVKAYGPISQGKFLVSMGAQERVISHIQKDSTTDEEAEHLFGALNRLVAPEEMGTRYKVLSIAPERQKEYGSTSYSVPPPGF